MSQSYCPTVHNSLLSHLVERCLDLRPLVASLPPRAGRVLLPLGLLVPLAGCPVIIEIPQESTTSSTDTSTDTDLDTSTDTDPDTTAGVDTSTTGCTDDDCTSAGDSSGEGTTHPPEDPSHCVLPFAPGVGGLVEHSQELPLLGPIEDLHVLVRVSHPSVGNLQITVEHDGVTRMLLDHPLGGECHGSQVDAIFDDDAELPGDDTCAKDGSAIAGAVLPTQSLAPFLGMEAGGEWILRVTDEVDPNDPAAMVLDSWCIVASTDGPLVLE